MIDTILAFYSQFSPDFEKYLASGLIIFARVMGFIKYAPGFARKEVHTMAKIAFGVVFTVIICTNLPVSKQPADASFVLTLSLNVLFGALMAYIANCILNIVEAGGDMINMQMGLNAASVFDPTTSQQSSVMGRFFALFGLLLFINLGGFYWLFSAFVRSFDVFPIWATGFDIEKLINIPYLVELTSNVLYVGLQIAAPVLLATLGQDIILGVISRTAPQVNVFTMSFLFKPIVGCAILMWIMGSLVNVVNDYFLAFSNIF